MADRVTQVTADVMGDSVPNARVTQVSIDVVSTNTALARITQVSFDVAIDDNPKGLHGMLTGVW